VRTVMESDDGFDSRLVTGLAGQGVAGILVGQRFGGSGLGLLDAVVAAEEIGRAAAPYSAHSAAVMAPLALMSAASEAQREMWLPRVVAGEAIVSYVDRGARIDGDRLVGRASLVADTNCADVFVVACLGDHRPQWLLVPRDAPGVEIDALASVDETRRIGEIVFDDVPIEEGMRMGDCDLCDGDRIMAAGRIALAADALGAAERALEAAVEYVKTRRQFGRVIASFQAVKHMCAEAIAEIEPLRSLLWYAAFAWDESRDDAFRTALLLKAHAGEVCTRVLTTCVQLYGGMGFTYECDVHVWFKRVGYDRQVLGGPTQLRAEAAQLRF